jgi:hypothetical protein
MCYCKLKVQMVERAYSARSYDKGHDAMNNLEENQKVVFVQIYDMSIIRTHVGRPGSLPCLWPLLRFSSWAQLCG